MTSPAPVDHTYVIIMAGGGGTRLWPQSLRQRPKQFLPLLPGGETLLAATVRRITESGVAPIERILAVTAAAQVTQVRAAVPALPIDNILVEPIGRNTAPCIGLSALAVLRRDPEGVMAVLPSDHHITDDASFGRVLRQALSTAARGHVVTVGIRPTRPETGYGYIRLAAPRPDEDGRMGAAFVEKPDPQHAAEYVAAGNYLWNSGMFFFPAAHILKEIAERLPSLGALLDELRDHPERTAARYPEAPAISIDYAVMEHLGQDRAGAEAAIRVVSGDFGWNDVGSFAALADLHSADGDGNHVLLDGPAIRPVLQHSHGNIVWNSTSQLIAAVGVSDLVIVVTDSAVLVVPRAQAQSVRDVVTDLAKTDRSEYL